MRVVESLCLHTEGKIERPNRIQRGTSFNMKENRGGGRIPTP